MLALADASITDYQLQSTIYDWYGKLDKPELNLPASATVDLKEYPNGQRTAGAHHILSITPTSRSNGKQSVEVELEFLAHDSTKAEVVGQYVIQNLLIDAKNQRVVSSKTELNEFDDFTSNYRDAGDLNLIKSLVFGWTHILDKLSEGQIVSTKLLEKFASESGFSAEESTAVNPQQYLEIVKTQNYKQSRRAIKNLNIRQSDDNSTYLVSYQYVWNASNHDNENELAQVGIELQVSIVNGKVKIQSYKAKYLPPVTDLGAEIRC